MSRYYDYFDRCWAERPTHIEFAAGRRLRRGLRRQLLPLLESEIDGSADPIIQVYALMLARQLCQTDLELMKEFGKRFTSEEAA
jgi:hypothetical protein